MATITVPAEFFRGELRVYSDWREAFARELLQNALDAHPSRISVSFSAAEGSGEAGENGRVTFEDDGIGMSRDVLENVFFALGRTTKNTADTIGGFGRARIIICFAQLRYEIRTGFLRVTGVGGEYTVESVPDFHKGCRFTIDVLDSTAAQVKFAFERLLGLCNLDVPILLDGETVRQPTTPPRAACVLRDDDGRIWGRIYADPDGVGQLIVRVHGLAMYRRWLPGSDDIYVEILPNRSRDVLAASRDLLNDPFADQVDKFVADLSGNRRRALRPTEEPLDVRIGGGGFFRTDSPTDVSGLGDLARPAGGTDELVRITAANAAASAHLRKEFYGPEEQGPGVPALRGLGFDVYLMADSSSRQIRRLARTWDPSAWGSRGGSRRRMLLLAWKQAVSFALDLLVSSHPEIGAVQWTVGWLFDPGVGATHRALRNGHVFALNPVTEDGRSRYQLSRKSDRRRLLVLAAHEVVHVSCENHDEAFASVFTELLGDLDPVLADRQIRAAWPTATRTGG